MANTKENTYKTKSGKVFVNTVLTEEYRNWLDHMRGKMSRSEFIRALIKCAWEALYPPREE